MRARSVGRALLSRAARHGTRSACGLDFAATAMTRASTTSTCAGSRRGDLLEGGTRGEGLGQGRLRPPQQDDARRRGELAVMSGPPRSTAWRCGGQRAGRRRRAGDRAARSRARTGSSSTCRRYRPIALEPGADLAARGCAPPPPTQRGNQRDDGRSPSATPRGASVLAPGARSGEGFCSLPPIGVVPTLSAMRGDGKASASIVDAHHGLDLHR